MRMSKQKQHGFSILEMSVVLVVIGLIIGGVLYGTSLIRSAELQAVIKERGLYTRAINEFKDKYYELPGDYSEAASVWGTDAPCPNYSYLASVSNSTATCSGDGNGRIGNSLPGGAISVPNEWWRAWQHLVNAKFIDGRYTGRRGTATSFHAIPGLNVPESEMENAGWTLYYYQTVATNNSFYGEPTGGYGHILAFGGQHASLQTYQPIITATDALELDAKIDDGKPGTGNVRAWRTTTLPTCTMTDTSQTNQAYNITNDNITCALIFITGL